MNKIKLCLVASAGGHYNQMINLYKILSISDLSKYFEIYLVFIKRGDTKNNKKIKYFINPTERNIFKTLKNFYQSFKIFQKEKPDLVISTGAGDALASMLIAKLFGKKVIFIESFSRFNSLSLTGKLVYNFVDKFYVQWKSMLKFKKAEYIGQLLSIKPIKFKKIKKSIFLTVGTSSIPFNRLIKFVDDIALELKDYTIFGQIGNSNYVPNNFKYERYLTNNEMIDCYRKSNIVICHAGTGSITNALTYSCKVYVMPRLKKYKENVDDHQLEIAENFNKIGVINIIDNKKKIINKLNKSKKISNINFKFDEKKLIAYIKSVFNHG